MNSSITGELFSGLLKSKAWAAVNS